MGPGIQRVLTSRRRVIICGSIMVVLVLGVFGYYGWTMHRLDDLFRKLAHRIEPLSSDMSAAEEKQVFKNLNLFVMEHDLDLKMKLLDDAGEALDVVGTLEDVEHRHGVTLVLVLTERSSGRSVRVKHMVVDIENIRILRMNF